MSLVVWSLKAGLTELFPVLDISYLPREFSFKGRRDLKSTKHSVYNGFKQRNSISINASNWSTTRNDINNNKYRFNFDFNNRYCNRYCQVRFDFKKFQILNLNLYYMHLKNLFQWPQLSQKWYYFDTFIPKRRIQSL